MSLHDAKMGASETLTCTPEHPFFVPGTGWVEAGSLGIGTSIVTRAGPCLSVSGRLLHEDAAGQALPERVYNFTVADDHTYFVGTTGGGIWVHNSSFNETFASRKLAFNATKDRAGIPRSQQPVTQWEVGADRNRRTFANYRYSPNDPTAHGRYYVYDTPNGPRVIAEHTNDGPSHFHAGQPGDPITFTNFKSERYKPVGGKHHLYY